MGLRMNIHEPSVAPANQGTSSSSSEEPKPVLDLISKKDELEAELTALGGVLESVCFLRTSSSRRQMVAEKLTASSMALTWKQA